MNLSILFEDNHLLVINKPGGLLTQPSGTEQESLERLAKSWMKEIYKKPGNVFLEAIHRLDKPVSGIVVFAKTSKALSRLNASIREKKAKKTYFALLENKPPSTGLLEHYMIHDDYRATIVSKNNPRGKKATLSFEMLKETLRGFLVKIELDTGRYHQIRVQFAEIGCPIVGDQKYGAKSLFEAGVIGLHHGIFEVPHPVISELCHFEAPLHFRL
ncbi:MAG: RNA pseudouridine synthase [Parachlamydia sp.]|jgi:23S rRNA pseudouridine1911/1915/1917 synthase|nr:RNA pseudouridine synthase [Parachlamydia sp.]